MGDDFIKSSSQGSNVPNPDEAVPSFVSRSLARFFFFQAEDGIRDVAVTGVQTCALPICFIPKTKPFLSKGKISLAHAAKSSRLPWIEQQNTVEHHDEGAQRIAVGGNQHRSEERRVGKECRSRWSPYH